MRTTAVVALTAALNAGVALAEPAVLVFGEGADRLEIATGALAGIEVIRRRSGVGVGLRLDADSARAFARWTSERIGQEIPVVLCGEELMRPRLMEAIVGGSVMISRDNLDAARTLAARLRAADCPGG